MTKQLYELTFEEYTTLLKSGMMYVYYPECTGNFNRDTESPEEKRMDVIGQNGNDGEHYGEEVKITYVDVIEHAWPEDRISILSKEEEDNG